MTSPGTEATPTPPATTGATTIAPTTAPTAAELAIQAAEAKEKADELAAQQLLTNTAAPPPAATTTATNALTTPPVLPTPNEAFITAIKNAATLTTAGIGLAAPEGYTPTPSAVFPTDNKWLAPGVPGVCILVGETSPKVIIGVGAESGINYVIVLDKTNSYLAEFPNELLDNKIEVRPPTMQQMGITNNTLLPPGSQTTKVSAPPIMPIEASFLPNLFDNTGPPQTLWQAMDPNEPLRTWLRCATSHGALPTSSALAITLTPCTGFPATSSRDTIVGDFEECFGDNGII